MLSRPSAPTVDAPPQPEQPVRSQPPRLRRGDRHRHPISGKARAVFISYNGLLELLGESQILPYVRALAADYDMTVLSYEKPVRGAAEDAADRSRLQAELNCAGIRWISLRYHKRPSLPATVYDIVNGIRCLLREHRRQPIRLVHARGYVPGAVAWAVQRLARVPYLFDIRGLQAEEYVDAGSWSRRSLAYRLTTWMEQKMLRRAAGLVTLTDAIRPKVQELPGLRSRRVMPPWETIPSCVDMDRFRFDPEARERIRAVLGVVERPVIVYAGSLGTWYLLDEMVRFVATAREHWPELFLLVLTNSPADAVRGSLRRNGVGEQDSAVRWARPEEMPGYLSAADAGLAFIKPCLSKRSSSPTKYAEYLACGLPLVINAGIGDADRLIEEQGAGVLIRDFTPQAYAAAVPQLRERMSQGRAAFRAVAEAEFSLADRAMPAYRRLYRQALRPRRRLLVLCPYPVGQAPSQRLKFEQYYAHFAAEGFEVTVSPFVSPALWRILYQPGRVATKAAWTLWGYVRRSWDFLRAGRFDAVYLHLWALPFGQPRYEERLAARRIPLVYDIDDLIYLPNASQANSFVRRARGEAQVGRIMKAASHVIVSTPYLQGVAQRYNPAATYISSTIDTQTYAPKQHSRRIDGVTIGWSGSHSTSAYVHLLQPVLEPLSRRHDLRLLVIGDPAVRLPGVRVEARPWVRERETADLAEMDIGVYPLPDEEWVQGKSGLKALQYMGMGIPVVASRIGAATEFIRDGENGFLAGTPDEWMEKLSRLILDPDLRSAMGRAGRATVEERFSVEVTASAYVSILDSVCAGDAR